MRGWTIAALVLALAACNGGTAQNETADAAINAAAGNDAGDATNYQAAVIALPPEQRDMVFIRAIQDAGLPCQGVTESTRLADHDGAPTWRARCAGGGAHMISITRDGTANIISRAGA